ncbi:MAG: cell division topological specificity factor MinE [Thiomargarita sp.]|nr:cell division topological specificity factor MinE [Thiomargarita sp.]
MSFLHYFIKEEGPSSALIAKERLQIIVAHERRQRDGAVTTQLDRILPQLQQEILDVVKKYMKIGNEDVKINVEQEGKYEVLELNIILPENELKLRHKKVHET